MPSMRYLQLDQRTILPRRSAGMLVTRATVLSICFILVAELLTLLDLQANSWIRLLLLVGSLALVTISANAFGFKAGLTVASISTAYIAYRYFAYDNLSFEESLRINVVFGIANFIMAILLGRLRTKLDATLDSERLARSEAEDRQRQLEIILQHMPVGVMIVDMADHHISYSNHQAENLLGISFDKNSTLADSFPIDLEGELAQSDWPLHKTLQSLETITDQEVHYMRVDGQAAHLKINAAPVYSLQGKPIAAIATILDISLAKELEQRKDEFISIASHELKTPVTSLKIYLQLLEKQANILDEAGRLDLIHKANRQVTRLASLMTELLDLSRLQSNKTEYSFKEQRLGPLVCEAVEIIQPSASQKIQIEGEALIPVLIDGPKIQQVVANLLANAVKYSAHDSSITISVSQTKTRTIVKVIDQGIGIAEPDQNKIFDLFFQANSPNKKSYPGLGIGLYISQQIVAQHEGRIAVQSKLGKGSCFSIILPIKKSLKAK